MRSPRSSNGGYSAGAPASTNRLTPPFQPRRGAHARVISYPDRTSGPAQGPTRRQAIAALLALVLVIEPSVLVTLGRAFLPLILVVALLLWLVGRLGFGWLAVGAMSRTSGATSTVDMLTFRCNVNGWPRDVRLLGHRSGISVGDELVLYGTLRWGIIEPTAIKNLTTGTTLRRYGTLRRHMILAAVLAVVAKVLL